MNIVFYTVFMHFLPGVKIQSYLQFFPNIIFPNFMELLSYRFVTTGKSFIFFLGSTVRTFRLIQHSYTIPLTMLYSQSFLKFSYFIKNYLRKQLLSVYKTW